MERRVLVAITLSFLVLFSISAIRDAAARLCAAATASERRCSGCTAPVAPSSGASGRPKASPGTPTPSCGTDARAPTPTGPDDPRRRSAKQPARDRCRDEQGESGVLEPRREDRALDLEGVPQRRGAAARSRPRRRRRRHGQAVHTHRRRPGHQRAPQRGNLSRHGERESRRRQGRRHRVAADDRVRSRGVRRLERQEDL